MHVSRNKRVTLFWTITPTFLGGFLHFLYQWKTGMNILQRSYKIDNFNLTVSPHYLIKLKQHTNVNYNYHTILLLDSENEPMS